MAQISIYNKYSISIPNAGVIEIGSLTTPAVITLDSTAPDILSGRVTLADNAESEIVTSLTADAGNTLADFKVFIGYASVDMSLSWASATLGANSCVKIKGGTYFHLTSDDIKDYDSNYATRIADTAVESNIVAFHVGNNSGSTGYFQYWIVR